MFDIQTFNDQPTNDGLYEYVYNRLGRRLWVTGEPGYYHDGVHGKNHQVNRDVVPSKSGEERRRRHVHHSIPCAGPPREKKISKTSSSCTPSIWRGHQTPQKARPSPGTHSWKTMRE